MNILSIVGFCFAAAFFAFVTKMVIKQFMLLSFQIKVKELIRDRMKNYQVMLDEEKDLPEEDRVLNSTMVIPVGPIDILELFDYSFGNDEEGNKKAAEFISGKFDNTTMWLSVLVTFAIAVFASIIIVHYILQVPWIILGLAFAWLAFVGILFV